MPLTRVAIGGMSPIFAGAGRAVIAALVAATVLAATRQRLPRGAQWVRLAVVALGVVAGFPLLTSVALTTASASHGAVVIGFLPAATAVFAVLRARERPGVLFWIFALLGAVAALGFAVAQSGVISRLQTSDLLFFFAVIAAAIGYAEGGMLARELGSWQTVSWALVMASPVMLAVTVAAGVAQPPTPNAVEWLAFAYLSLVSMYLGFFAWYRGLAIGPIAQVSQIQLVQPVMTMVWAAVLLGEQIGWLTALGGAAVIVCAALAVRVRAGRLRKVLTGRAPGS